MRQTPKRFKPWSCFWWLLFLTCSPVSPRRDWCYRKGCSKRATSVNGNITGTPNTKSLLYNFCLAFAFVIHSDYLSCSAIEVKYVKLQLLCLLSFCSLTFKLLHVMIICSLSLASMTLLIWIFRIFVPLNIIMLVRWALLFSRTFFGESIKQQVFCKSYTAMLLFYSWKLLNPDNIVPSSVSLYHPSNENLPRQPVKNLLSPLHVFLFSACTMLLIMMRFVLSLVKL